MRNAVQRSLTASFLIVASAFSLNVLAAEQVQVFNDPGSDSFNVPAGVTEITVEVWGGGGRGGSTRAQGNRRAGGGGGGAYASSKFTVSPGDSFSLTVGAGSDSEASGGESLFEGPNDVIAAGGASVAQDVQNGAAGGAQSASQGNLAVRPGGDGAASQNKNGGGGGSSAGPDNPGTTATSRDGAAAPAGGGDGGDGGTRGAGDDENGQGGAQPGGGGGGATSKGTSRSGGPGGDGRVRVTYQTSDDSLRFDQQPTDAGVDAPLDPPVTVHVEDGDGNRVQSYDDDVTLQLENNPGSGTLAGTTTVAAENGIASFDDLSIDAAGDGYTLRATAANTTDDVSAAFDILADAVVISGQVLELGTGREGVEIIVDTGSDVATDADGRYSATVSSGADVTLTPQHDDLIFCPASRTVPIRDADRPGIGFQAFPDVTAPVDSGSGGDAIFTDQGDIVHVFCSTGSAQFTPPAAVSEVEVLVAGGGGGGGAPLRYSSAGGGGGGAGGLIHKNSFPISGEVDVTVGSGGARGDTIGQFSSGGNGDYSKFADLTALGGGGGAGANCDDGSDVQASDGGSAGGSRGECPNEGKQPNSSSGGFGSDGGAHIDTGADPNIHRAAGGGGGAGEAGESLAGDPGEDGGFGGEGLEFATIGEDLFYAGGGGGGAADYGSNDPGDPGAGGDGGGGRGGRTGIPAVPGFPGTGGGGGGGNNAVPGAVGGSGIVIVRYAPFPAAVLELRMEEASWGDGATAVDSSGSGNDGIVSGDADTAIDMPAIPGDPGTCRYGVFNGDDGFITVSHDNRLEASNKDAVTVTAWVRQSADQSQDPWIALVQKSDASYNLQLENGDAPVFTVHDGGHNIARSGITLAQGQWYHLAGVYDGDEARIYVNGEQEGAIDVTDTITDASSFDVGIGENLQQNGRHFSGFMDEVRIYDRSLSESQVERIFQNTRPCVSADVDHYAISHVGPGVTCLATDVTITAHDSGDNPVDPGSATLDLSTTKGKGDWITVTSGSGGLSNVGSTGNGQAQYDFPGGESSVTLTLNYTDVGAGNSETFNIDVDDGSATDKRDSSDPEDPDLTFALTGLRFANIDDGNATIPTQLSDKPSDTGHNSRNLALQAIRASDSDPSQCNAAFPDGSDRDIEIAGECRNPSACAGEQVRIINNASPNTIPTNNDNSVPGTSFNGSISMRFTDNGSGASQAEFALRYPDAGLMQLHARYNIPLDDGSPSGDYMIGSSNDFVVRPFGFYLDFDPDGDSVFNDRANNAACADQVSCAANAGGDVFATAGVAGTDADFDVQINAVVWQAGDDDGSTGGSANDGIPDSNRALRDNASTPNFGNEGATVDLSHTLVAPSAGIPGSLTGASGIGGFAGGDETVSGVAWSEVGIINLNANLSSNAYLGAGDDVTGTAPNLGRFIPDRFTISDNDPALRDGTGMWGSPFTYMGQAFTFASTAEPEITVTAVNTDGVTTTNYGGEGTGEDFWRLDTPAPTYADATSGLDATFSADTSGGSQTWDASGSDTRADYDGQGTLTISGDEFTYDRIDADTKQVPFDAMIDLTLAALDLSDDDNACFEPAGTCSGFTLDGDDATPGQQAIGSPAGTSTEQRYGRLLIDNAFGPEIAPVYVPMRVEYWDNGTWQVNEQDVSTELALGELALANADGMSQPGNSDIVVDTDNFTEDANDTQEAGETMIDTTNTPVPVRVGVDAGAVINDPGTVEIVMLPPGAENRGWVDIEALLPGAGQSYLQYDWDADGDPSLDDNPAARVTFGIFAGEEQHIYLREVFPAP